MLKGENLVNKHHAELMLRYGVVREACADLFERLNHLELVDGPALASRYMMELGQYEMREFELTMEVRRWQRRFELRQAAVNAGEMPDLMAIETALDKEFAEFEAKLVAFAKEMDEATMRFHARTLTAEQSTDVRVLYLNAAKRLHPDVNPEATEAMAKLWQRIKTAYADRSWSELRFLCGLIGTVAEKPRKFPKTRAGVESLSAEIVRLERLAEEQRAQIAELNGRAPWSYRAQLENAEGLQAEQERLQEEIAACQQRVAEYEMRWKEGVAA